MTFLTKFITNTKLQQKFIICLLKASPNPSIQLFFSKKKKFLLRIFNIRMNNFLIRKQEKKKQFFINLKTRTIVLPNIQLGTFKKLQKIAPAVSNQLAAIPMHTFIRLYEYWNSTTDLIFRVVVLIICCSEKLAAQFADSYWRRLVYGWQCRLINKLLGFFTYFFTSSRLYFYIILLGAAYEPTSILIKVFQEKNFIPFVSHGTYESRK